MLMNFDNLVEDFKLNITGVIHIGAWQGAEYDSAYKRYPSIKNVVFFEPDPDTFKILESNVSEYDNVICVNKALGPFSCTMKLNRDDGNEGQSSSLLEPLLHLQQYPGILFPETIEVPVEPLDKFAPNSSLNFINIDVQGFELEVFRGAKNTLKNVDYIMAEVNRAELYKNCCQVEELDEYLKKFGFNRVKTEWENYGRGTWGDALYIKDK